MADAGEPAPAEESLALLEAGGEGAVLPSKGPPELRIMLLGLWLMSCAGLQYSFSTYSPVVVANLRLTQSQLGIMALGKDIGAYLAVFQGVFYDRAGGRATLVAGGAALLAGYFGLFALLRAGPKTGPAELLWPGFFLIMLSSMGGSFIDMACVMTLLHNASRERALVTGISKALLGLGASIFTSLYVAFLAPNTLAYLVLCALLPCAVIAVSLPTFRKLPRAPLHAAARSPMRTAVLLRFLTWVFSLCAFLLLLVLLSIFIKHEGKALLRTLTIALLLLLVIPPAVLGAKASRASPAGFDQASEAALTQPLLAEEKEEGGKEREGEAAAAAAEPPKLHGQASAVLTLRQCLLSPEFLGLFLAMSAGMGGTLVLVNNLSQVAKSLHCASGAPYVSLFGVCSASGRLLTGLYGTRLRAPRPVFLVAALSGLAVTLSLCSTASCVSLFAAVAVVGHCFGCMFAFVPVLAGDLFGEANAGSMYGFLGASPAVGSFFLNTLVTGRVYAHHAHPAAVKGDPAVCDGIVCFRATFLVSGGACAAGVVAAVWLLRRTRHMYAGL